MSPERERELRQVWYDYFCKKARQYHPEDSIRIDKAITGTNMIIDLLNRMAPSEDFGGDKKKLLLFFEKRESIIRRIVP